MSSGYKSIINAGTIHYTAFLCHFPTNHEPKAIFKSMQVGEYSLREYRIPGNFHGAKFSRNKNSQKIFSRMIHVCNVKGVAWQFSRNLISRKSKNREIHENLAPRKFPGIWYITPKIQI